MRVRQVVSATVIFLGAFLLFVVEPLSSKELLPTLGGSAGVWLCCLCFFQVFLLFGYLYAALLTGTAWGRRVQQVHLSFLVICTCWGFYRLYLPPTDLPLTRLNPLWTILRSLTLEVGFPFLLLSATSPMLQVWLARWNAQGIPFRLYALSNVGSLLALLTYPVLIEPHLTLHRQRELWAVGFALYSTLFAWLIVSALRSSVCLATPLAQRQGRRNLVRSDRMRLYFLLGATGTIQLCTVTSHLTENVAALPLLWILPLSVYLLSFVLAFEFPNLYRRDLVLRFLVVMLASLGYLLSKTDTSLPLGLSIAAFLIELFFACWFCHAELYALRPEHHSATPWYYLVLAAGGATGTVLSVIILPMVSNANYDLPLAFALIAAVALRMTWQQGWSTRLLWATSAILCVALTERLHTAYHRNAVFLQRNFYGSLRVKESYLPVQADVSRLLLHGTIEHGMQWFSPDYRAKSLTYYGQDSGVGLALRLCCQMKSRTIGVIGLGVGTLAAFGKAGDSVRFYEINPAVEQVAKELFTYLRQSEATVTVVDGDARRSLDDERSVTFDVLAVDAFSGDAIPAHLLTLEAMQVYRRHLKEGGVLAFHISNQYVDLLPVVGSLAAHEGWTARLIDSPADPANGLFAARWIIMANPQATIFSGSDGGPGEPLPKSTFTAWTDDFFSLLPVMRWGGTSR